jgi:hypothetical protein
VRRDRGQNFSYRPGYKLAKLKSGAVEVKAVREYFKEKEKEIERLREDSLVISFSSLIAAKCPLSTRKKEENFVGMLVICI